MPAVFERGTANRVTQQQTDFAADFTPYTQIIQDSLVSTLSCKTSNDLLQTNGKDQLKQDLINNVNKALHDQEEVVNVYFTSFIIQ